MKYHCGPSWAPEWLKKILSYKFNASCKIHDLDYTTTKYTRKEADVRFLYHMMRQAEGSILWESMAILYFMIVRFFGVFSWGK